MNFDPTFNDIRLCVYKLNEAEINGDTQTYNIYFTRIAALINFYNKNINASSHIKFADFLNVEEIEVDYL